MSGRLIERLGRRPAGQHGQTLVEFALVVPIFFLLTLGLVESGLLMFTVATGRFAAGDAARVASQYGRAASADTAACLTVARSALGTTSLAQVTEIDVYQLTQSGSGTLSPVSANTNKYRLNGSTISQPWPPSLRSDQSGNSDFIGISIYYTYRWKLGVLSFLQPPSIVSTYYVRIEPQTY